MPDRVDVQLIAEDGEPPSPDVMREWAAAALTASGYARAAVTLRIVDEDESRTLNRQYRGRDNATNVLSFPFSDVAPEAMEEIGGLYLGDIVICAAVVKREATEQAKDPLAHWAHMVVHGVLHLAGEDHDDDEAAHRMERHEIGVLASLGFPDPYESEPS